MECKPITLSCCVCTEKVANGSTEPINEYQAKCISLVLNFESCFLNAETVSELNFLQGHPCSSCEEKLIETESIVEDWELLRSRLKSTARQLRQIISTRVGFTKASNISKTEIQKKSGLITGLRSRTKKKLINTDKDSGIKIHMSNFLTSIFPKNLVADEEKSDTDKSVTSTLETDSNFNDNDNDDIVGGRLHNNTRNTSFELMDTNWVRQHSTRSSKGRSATNNILHSYIDVSSGNSASNKAFTPRQIRALQREYNRLESTLHNSRFDDPNVEIREMWELIAIEVSKAGFTKSPAQCWKRIQAIIRTDMLYEASKYKIECPNAEFTLRHCQLILQRCDSQDFVSEKILKSNLREATSLGQYCPPEGKLETCFFPTCDYTTTNCDRLRGHYNREHLKDAYPFKCMESNCGKSYKSYDSLNIHRGKHTGFFPFSCDQCDRKFAKKIRMIRHKHQVHEGGTPDYQCHLCPKKFFTQSLLIGHSRYMHEEKTAKCSVLGCDAVFALTSQLYAHCRSKHPSEFPNLVLPSIMCPECGKICSGESNFKRHSLKHRYVPGATKRREKKYHCSYEGCRYKGVDHSSVRHHVRLVHETFEKSFICEYEGCGAAYKTELSRKRHTKEKHEITSKELRKHECPICRTTLNNAASLQVHLAVRHTTGNERDFVCEKCDRGFPTRRYVLRHHRMYPNCQPKKPPGPNAVQCEICKRYCSNLAGLKRHCILIHEDVEQKPWKCLWCGRGWPIKMYLTRHQSYCKLKPKDEHRENLRTSVKLWTNLA